VALLLANRIADRVLDPDAPELTLLAPDPERGETWVRALDGAMPRAGLITQFADDDQPVPDDVVEDPDGGDGQDETAGYPLLENGWLRSTLDELIDTYATALSAAQVADPDRLLDAAMDLLAELDMVIRVPGGVLARPLLARYRNAVVSVRPAAEPAGLFDLGG